MALFDQSNGKDAAGRRAPGETVYLAAFGKHPGWDDHIEDLGLETDGLREVWRLLYTEGIGKNLAAWNRLAPEQRKEEFSHLFVFAAAGGVTVGRMWSSRDGKGRAFYPMVVCAECLGASVEWALRQAMPVLADLEGKCRATSSAQDVRALVDAARVRLRQEAAGPAGQGPPQAPPPAAGELLDGLEKGSEGRAGIHRILYYLAQGMSRRPGAACSLRVPRCAASAAEAVGPWLALLRRLVDPQAPVVAIAPLDDPWLDLIAGPPAPDDFFCIRAATGANPPVTQIAYTLEPAFVERADRLLAGLRAGEPVDLRSLTGEADSRPDAGPARRAGPGLAARLAEAAGDLADAVRNDRKTRKRLMVLGIVALVLAAALAAAALWPAPPRDAPGGPGDGGTPATGQAMDPNDWREFCQLHNLWFGRFLGGLEAHRRRWRGDPDLAAMLSDLDAARSEGVEFNPRRLAGVTGLSREDLAKSPPASVRTPAAARRVGRAVRLIRQVEDVVTGKRWALWTRLDQFRLGCERRGWRRCGEAVQRVLADLRPQVNVAEAIDRAVELGEPVTAIDADWRRIEESAYTIQGAGDPLLARFSQSVAGELAPWTASGAEPDFPALRRKVAAAAAQAVELAAFVQGDWARRIDRGLVKAEPPVPAGGANVPLQAYADWLAQLRDTDRWDKVRPGEDPRDPNLAKALAALQARIGADLRKKDGPGADRLEKKLAPLMARAGRLDAEALNRRRLEEVRKEAASLRREQADLAADLVASLRDAGKSVQEFLDSLPATICKSAKLNQAWIDRRTALRDWRGDLSALRAAAEAERIELLRLDAEFPGAPVVEANGPPWRKALWDAVDDRREAALARQAGALKWDERGMPADSEAAQKPRAESSREFAKFVQGVAGLGGRMMAEEAGLDAWALPADSASASLESLRKAPAFADPAVAEALAPLVRRLEALAKLAGLSRAELVDRAERAEGKVASEVLFETWRQLHRSLPAWPAEANELRVEQALSADLLRRTGRITDANRAGSLHEAIALQRRASWAGCLNVVPAGQVEAVLALAQDFGVAHPGDEPGLLPHARFNAMLFEFRQGARGLDANEAEAMRWVQEFRERKSWPADNEPIQRFLKRLDDLRVARQASGDVTRAGPASLPGKLGWRVKESNDARVVYATPDGNVEDELEFLLLQGGGPDRVFLCTTEVRAGLFLDVLAAADDQKYKDMLTLLDWKEGRSDIRRGPRTLEVRSERGKPVLRLCDEWLGRSYGDDSNLHYPPGRRPNPPRPEARSPVQYVPVTAAIEFCCLLGCRLPTAAEWQLAYKMTPGGGETGPWNLRGGASWTAQKAHGEDRSPQFPLPSAGTTWDSIVGAGTDGNCDARDGADDGRLWFANVASDRHRFHHLVGNVAEFVSEANWSVFQSAFAEPQSAEAIRALCTKAPAGTLGVIGGSALSPKEVEVAKSYPLGPDTVGKWSADIGLRLALTAPGEATAARVKRLLDSQPYLPPPAPAPRAEAPSH